MDEFASIPGAWYGSQQGDVIDADAAFPGVLDNLLVAYGGNDYVLAGKGDDFVLAGNGDDTVFGGAGDDVLVGDNGNDSLDGGSGDDVIDGGKGDDWMVGASGADTLAGGEGDDTMAGGADADVFYFESKFGGDVILDFRAGQDMLALKAGLNGTGINDPSDLAAYVKGGPLGAVISIGGDSITLVGVSRTDLLNNLDDYVKIV